MSFDLEPLELTEQQWQNARARFAKEGIEVPDEASGEISKDGIASRFTWDGHFLRITITKKPFLYPPGLVSSRIAEFILTA
tara:strand:- start:77 stop:319 length:243 start_codon:yes stop_codon:yes gene_type:complete